MNEAVKRIVCDNCGATGPEALESEDPRQLAIDVGWYCEDEANLCPVCALKGWEDVLEDALACLPGIETLATRYSDRLDFHEIGVGCLRNALIAAYRSGRRHERAKPQPQ